MTAEQVLSVIDCIMSLHPTVCDTLADVHYHIVHGSSYQQYVTN